MWIYNFAAIWIYNFAARWIHTFVAMWIYSFAARWIYSFAAIWIYNFAAMGIYSFVARWIYSCVDAHVAARAGRAIVQFLHDCSPAWRATLTYTKVMHTYIYICRYTSHLHISNIYFLCIKQNHLHERQSEEMIPAVVGHSTKWGVLDPAGLGAGEWGMQAIVGWQALPPPIMGGIQPAL